MQQPTEVLRHAARQCGVVSLQQARDAGLSTDAVRHRVATGVWQRLLPRVYATFSGPVPYSAKMWAAVLYAGSGAVVSHTTAAHAFGWTKVPTSIEVTVPPQRRVREQPSLRIHRTTLAATDIAAVRRLPVTAPWRTAVDLVMAATDADEAIGVAADAVASRRVTAQHLTVALMETPNARFRSLLLDALKDVAAGSNSALELKFAVVLRRHGIPLGVRQQRTKLRGREIRIDMAWPGVAVELDGLLGHRTLADRHRDMDRDNRHAATDTTTLRFGWADVVARPCDVAALVAEVLTANGLEIKGRRCGAMCKL